MKLKLQTKKFGFTLIELLIVVTIISILVSLGTISYFDAQKRGRDSKRISDLETIKKALQLYYNDNGKYPYSDWVYSGGSGDRSTWISALVPTYIKSVPIDPINKSNGVATTACNPNSPALNNTCFNYGYYSYNDAAWCGDINSNGQYILVARLESNNSKSRTYKYINPATGNECVNSPWGNAADPGLYVTGQ